MEEMMSAFTQKRVLLSEVTNSCFLPINNPSINSPAVCKKRPAPIAQNKLAFCPSVTLPQMNFQKLPSLVYSATSPYISPTPRLGKVYSGLNRLAM